MDQVTRYEQRVRLSERAAELAESRLAAMLSTRGRLPGSWTESEYIDAVESAFAELEAAAEPVADAVARLRRSPAAQQAIDAVVQAGLAAEFRTLADLSADDYLERYQRAAHELYPEILR